MDIELLGISLDVIGKVMIAYMAVAVHYRFRKEHKVDEAVFKMMKREQFIGLLGVAFIIAGYIFQLISRI